jgi:hypothetical protein
MALVLRRTALFVAFVLLWALVAAAVAQSTERHPGHSTPVIAAR